MLELSVQRLENSPDKTIGGAKGVLLYVCMYVWSQGVKKMRIPTLYAIFCLDTKSELVECCLKGQRSPVHILVRLRDFLYGLYMLCVGFLQVLLRFHSPKTYV